MRSGILWLCLAILALAFWAFALYALWLLS